MMDAIVIAALLILARIAAFVAFMPPFRGNGTPLTVKVGLAVALTCLLAPNTIGPTAAILLETGDANNWLSIALLIVRETLLGVGLAWLFGLILLPARIAGAYVAQEMGLTMGSQASPTDQQPTGIISQAMEAIAVLMLFTLNIHHLLFAAIGYSFKTRPVGGTWSLPSAEHAVHAVSQAEQQGLMLIAPVGILLFVTLVVVMATMRIAPQFNFMSFGMTIRLLAGFLALLLFLPELCAAMSHLLNRFNFLGA